MHNFDKKDMAILRRMQADSSVAVADLAEEIGLSVNACWRRVRRLQDEVVTKQVVILAP